MPDISCLRHASKESFVFTKGNETKGFDWSERCEEKVEVTAMRDQITSGGLMNEFAKAMNEGFVLEWQTDENCKECEASDGYCGYSNNRKEVLCFCKDGSVRSNNCDGMLSGSCTLLIEIVNLLVVTTFHLHRRFCSVFIFS